MNPNPRGQVGIDSVELYSFNSYSLNVYGTKDQDGFNLVFFVDTIDGVSIKSAHFIPPVMGSSGTGIKNYVQAVPIDSALVHPGIKLYIRACVMDQCWTSSNPNIELYPNPENNQDEVIAHGPLSRSYEFIYR
jgi:hypothetical protein